MQPKPLSLDLREISKLLREHSARDVALTPFACRRLGYVLLLAARKADDLEGQAADAIELDNELHALAADLGGPAPSLQTSLKTQQQVFQRELDRGGPVHVSRPGLAALSMPIGETNVFTFPRALSQRPLGGDDEGGSAA
ncbi:MAG: hypothetical protein DI527_07525 [Chelatococcus sp.]|nr:MAG: hypothetical protein DI527_07525 [Chelatococcus sp.]